MNEMMYRKKLLDDLPVLKGKIYSAFCSSDAEDTIWMIDDPNTTLYDKVCYQIEKWVKGEQNG